MENVTRVKKEISLLMMKLLTDKEPKVSDIQEGINLIKKEGLEKELAEGLKSLEELKDIVIAMEKDKEFAKLLAKKLSQKDEAEIGSKFDQLFKEATSREEVREVPKSKDSILDQGEEAKVVITIIRGKNSTDCNIESEGFNPLEIKGIPALVAEAFNSKN